MPSAVHTLLVLALLLGMGASAWQRKSASLRPPRGPGQWLRHTAGGVLMGAGAAMVPGGNDTLLLNALPTLATQAVAAYLALLVGIATALSLMHRAGLPMPAYTCSPDGCADVAEPAADDATKLPKSAVVARTSRPPPPGIHPDA